MENQTPIPVWLFNQVIVSNITIATILSLSLARMLHEVGLGGLIGVIFSSAFCHNNSQCAFFIDTGIALLFFVFTYPHLIKLKIVNDE